MRRFSILLLTLIGYAQSPDPALAIIEKRCLACHGPSTRVSGLDLSTLEAARRGGTRGPALAHGSASSSLLLQRVERKEMPPASPLAPAEVETLRKWIDGGAKWTPTPLALRRAGPDWWSLQPLRRPDPPAAPATSEAWARSPIDRFVFAKLRAAGLAPSPPASRRTLIRRATFDLLGLPPSPEEIEAFVADPGPDAYEKLIDRLLASPHYGERWARHWLDVVRFAESEAYERDVKRENAWPYRDYVIRAFNEDKSYRQFAMEQIAGDVMEPVTRDGVAAVTFLVAGPFDFIGFTASNAAMRALARDDQMEEMLGTIGQTFLGLTVNCARCHDHKFDPIPQRDYHRLRAVFEGVWHGERPWLAPHEIEERKQRVEPLDRRVAELSDAVGAIHNAARERVLRTRGFQEPDVPTPLARWTFDVDGRDSIGGLHLKPLEKGVEISGGRLRLTAKGVRTASLAADLRERTLEAWVTLKKRDERPTPVLRVENEAVRAGASDGVEYAGKSRRWIASSTGDYRTTEVGPAHEPAADQPVHLAFVWAADDSIALYRDGALIGRYKPEVPTPDGKLQTYGKGIGFIEFGGRGEIEIDEARLYGRALTVAEIEASHRAGAPSVLLDDLLNAMPEDRRSARGRLLDGLAQVQEKRKAIADPPMVYAGLLQKPDVGPEKPGGLSCLKALPFEAGDATPEADRRRKVAEWIADPANPLFARVMVNRVWQYHFGAGIVDTPNDFGYNGGRPSHPELLDWLASEFIAQGWSLKKLHRTIMLSQAYRQSAAFDERAASVDADNRLLWRFRPRRLEAEAVRDSMLAVSGALNTKLGGPSFRPFTTQFHGSYEEYTLIDSDDPEFNRRTIYRMNVNGGRSPLLEAMDCPTPAVRTPQRPVTTTPLQALGLMNNQLIGKQARIFAQRVRREAGGEVEAQVERAFLLAVGRKPSAQDRESSVALVKDYGLESLSWGLFNLNEFVYVN